MWECVSVGHRVGVCVWDIVWECASVWHRVWVWHLVWVCDIACECGTSRVSVGHRCECVTSRVSVGHRMAHILLPLGYHSVQSNIMYTDPWYSIAHT